MKKIFFALSTFLTLTFYFSPFTLAQDEVYNVGDAVQVFRNGQWNNGKILKTQDDFYEVSFYSYYKNYHEILPVSRLRSIEKNEVSAEAHVSQKQDPQPNLPSL